MKKNIQIVAVALILVIILLIVFFSINKRNDNDDISDPAGTRTVSGIIHKIENPNCFDISPDGEFVIGAGSSIYILSPDGELVSVFDMVQPVAALSASAGVLYAAAGSSLFMIDKDGKATLLTDFGSDSIIKSIKPADNDLFISDAGNKLLYKFDNLNKLDRIYSFEAPPVLQIASPWFDFMVLPDGNFWITNPGEHQIDSYSKDGDYIKSIPGSEETELFGGCCNPVLLDLIENNRLVTWEKGLNRLRIFGIDGILQKEIEVNDFFQADIDLSDITYKDGNLYLLDGDSIYVLEDV